MFQSATLKLTGWYLLILMVTSLLFSAGIYQLSFREVDARLQQFQSRFEQTGQLPPTLDSALPNNPLFNAYRTNQVNKAKQHLITSLAYINIVILVAGGAVSYLLARRTLHDIEEAHNAQSRFTSDASHELRTPLAVMKSEIEVMLRDPQAKKSDYRETLESSLEEVNNLTRLSTMLLELAKTNSIAPDQEPLSVDRIARRVINRQKQTAGRLKLTADTSITPIEGNEASLEELFTILIENALKYSPADSLVNVRVTQRPNRVCFEITNTGKGITPEALPHIFERFYRADQSRTGNGTGGYGLGLALAKQIVDLHHGDIMASSQLNHATIFTVYLPIKR